MEELKINESQNTIDFASNIGKTIELEGMVQNLRVLSWGAFLILRTPFYTIQTVIESDKNIDLDNIQIESTVRVKGVIKESNIKDKSLYPRNAEMGVEEITLISSPSEGALPLDTTKKELNASLDTKFDLRPLSLRHPKQRAIFKIAATVNNEFANYLTSVGFTRICSPKIVHSGAEGGANIFNIDYFDKEAYLAQSPQFYKQIMVGVFGRVFETGPVFRAEKHDTSRHLNEYISLDFELGFIKDFREIIQIEVQTINHILKKIESECSNEVELLNIDLPFIKKIYMLTLDEVHAIIFDKYKLDFRGEKDLAPKEEKLISEYAKKTWDTDFIFVTHYPSSKRPFYTMDDPSSPDKTLSFDLIFRGMEITTGGQRLHKYEDYINKMTKLGMNTELFDSYLQTFKYGMPPHGGLGLGLERFTARLCNLDNVKEASLFPRDINRLEP